MIGCQPQLPRLLVEELRIDTRVLYEFQMRPDLDDSPTIEHDDYIRTSTALASRCAIRKDVRPFIRRRTAS